MLILALFFSTFTPFFQTPFSPQKVDAAGESCSAGSGAAGGSNLQARVGGVALDQAATFLADMDDITGAYYDSTLDRIVFVGKKNTSLPEFDKDDLAVAIKAVIFNKVLPAVSIERDPSNPTGPNNKVLYYGGIEDTKFGKVLVDADYKMKKYEFGYDENQQIVTSSVPGYKSLLNRYLEKGPDRTLSSNSRFVIRPEIVSLKRDDVSDSFVFDQVKMLIYTEPLSPNNDPKFNLASQEFAQHHTDNYDLFAQETPSYADAKQLGKIVAVVKWISDTGIATDFHWAHDYEPKKVDTPTHLPKVVSPIVQGWQMSGGAEYYTPNTYAVDNGSSSSLKSASETVNAPKEDIHWTFQKDGQDYDAVAVTADAFRSLGSYSTSNADVSVPIAGDMNLAFQRSYSSFSGGQFGIGRGWSFLPAQLVDNSPSANGWRMSVCDTADNIYHRAQLAFQGPDGIRETYTYNCGYFPDDNSFHSKIDSAALSPTITLYTVTTRDQTQYLFEEIYRTDITNYTMRLTGIKDKNGNKITYNYDSADKLSTIVDDKGHAITLNYNNDGLVSSLVDWANRTIGYTYDAQGNLLSVTDPRGNITTYSYDANNKLISITDREGKTVVTNTYTPEAKLATQANASNLTSTYTYDDTNRTLQISDNQGALTRATYDQKARVVEQTDPYLKTVKYTYGVEFSPLTITDKNNNKITNTYDLNGNLTSTIYPDTKKVSYQYDAKNRVTKIIDERYGIVAKQTTFTYDPNGNLIQVDEAGKITNYTYDATGEALTVQDPRSNTTSWTRDNLGNILTEKDPTDKTTTFEYDVLGRLTKKTDPDLRLFSYTYDLNGNVLTSTNSSGVTTFQYDKENRNIKTINPNNFATTYTYNSSGSLQSVNDPLNNLTSYGYDPYQNLISQQDALNNTTLHVYDLLNRPTQSTTPLGKVSKWEYDANGNISKRIDANNATTLYTYDAFNRLTKITYPDLKTVNYTYDNRGNLTKMVDPVGTTNYTYDTFDRLLSAKNPYGRQISYTYDSTDNLLQLKYPDGRLVNYTYDNNNRLATVSDWNNNTTSYTYKANGLISTRTTPNGIITSYSYDDSNRLSSIEHAKAGSTLAKFVYERDSLGNITKATEEGSFFPGSIPTPTSTPTPTPTPIPTTSGEDIVITGMTTTPTTPVAGVDFTTSITVKNQGIAPTGLKVVTFKYFLDPAQSPSYTTSAPYTYGTIVDLDPGEEMVINKDIQFMTEGTHAIWVIADTQNVIPETNEDNNTLGPNQVQVVSTTTTVTPTPTGVLVPTATPTPTPIITPTPTPTSPPASGVDLVVTNVVFSPNPPVKGSTFTATATIKNQGTVTTGSKSIAVALYRDLATAPSYTTMYNSLKSSIMTIPAGASVNVTLSSSFSTSGSHNVWVLVDRSQTVAEVDENNNVYGPTTTTLASVSSNNFLAKIVNFFIPQASAQQVIPQYITTFTYDVLSRITDANYPDQIGYKYVYDKVDNRLSMQVGIATESAIVNFGYNNDNQAITIGSGGATYDNNGNQITRNNSQGTTSFLYNFEDRLTKYTPPTGSATTYTYDGNSNRLAKAVGGTTTRFVTDISGSLSRTLAETNSFNSISKSYVYGLGLVSQGTTSTSSRNYYLEDGLGNMRFVTDSSGNKVRSTDYDPFGNYRAANGQANIQMLFQGQQLDPESNNYYMRARYYDPAIGRFISKDPIKGKLSMPQTQNPYVYSLNNPINLSDPSGKVVLVDDVAVLTIGACVVGAGYIATNPSVQHAISGAITGVINGASTLYESIKATNPAQDKKLTRGEIEALKKGGENIEEIKGDKHAGERDLFKDPKTGDIKVKPKDGSGPGEPTGLNIKDF